MSSNARNIRPDRATEKRLLRRGFSTGTAATAAARAALRLLLSGGQPQVVAVRLPSGCFLPIAIRETHVAVYDAWATVIKDAGDDPDVTHKAEIRARVRLLHAPVELRIERDESPSSGGSPIVPGASAGICLIGGVGVGVVTKPGLPVKVGEPAFNPVPREMLAQNLTEELFQWNLESFPRGERGEAWSSTAGPYVLLPYSRADQRLQRLLLEVEIQVPRGKDLAKYTLNPRLGIQEGISILGTTGIVKPFSHQAYEETIQAALSVAASNGCRSVVLSTGGKSERFAQRALHGWPSEGFVQIADFYAFAVKEAQRMGFEEIVHSVFFGKAVKMAEGHAYTHAHRVSLELGSLAEMAREQGCSAVFCRELATANTARHALEMLQLDKACGVIQSVARKAVNQSKRFSHGMLTVRLLLFDYDGTLLVDLKD